jgi:hypothetical protein
VRQNVYTAGILANGYGIPDMFVDTIGTAIYLGYPNFDQVGMDKYKSNIACI